MKPELSVFFRQISWHVFGLMTDEGGGGRERRILICLCIYSLQSESSLFYSHTHKMFPNNVIYSRSNNINYHKLEQVTVERYERCVDMWGEATTHRSLETILNYETNVAKEHADE
mmetsp:Transcript_4076/g.5006  ORF Transcript_4076/g.5006 Transcript_4076/m.5006 type:complete len:115 (+) Transcript_4076:79-423(+)